VTAAAIRTVLTLRARRLLGQPPQIGDLMASASGKTCYRVLGVARVITPDRPEAERYRLTCEHLPRREVPEGVAIHPWRWACQPPRRRAAEPPRSSEAVRPLQAARTPSKAPHLRAHDGHSVADLGPGLRRRAVRDRQGQLLREADVEVDDRAVDPRNPNRRVRRAYRVDPVDTLRREGVLGPREADAAAELRRHLEWIEPTLGAGSAMRVSASGFGVQPITDQHIRASRKLREAEKAVGDVLWPPVLWLCLGGSVRGYAAQCRVASNTAHDRVKSGMHRLADHFYGRAAA